MWAYTLKKVSRPQRTRMSMGGGKVFQMVPKIANHSIYVINVQCEKEPDFDTATIVGIVVFSVLGFFTLLGTAVDILPSMLVKLTRRHEVAKHIAADESFQFSATEKSPLVVSESSAEPPKPGVARRLLVSFSVWTNTKKLLSTSQAADSLSALNGVRFLSISWVVLGHSYAFVTSYIKNMNYMYLEVMQRWTFQAVGNALVSVDSFFALSGLLLAYLTLKELDRKQGARRFNWLMFYFHRFWRLTPALMLSLLVEVAFFKYFGDGPQWPYAGIEYDECKKSWWWNLLYINNFDVRKNVPACFGHAWYLANDMQFFVLSPLMLIPLYYNGVLGCLVCFAFILGTWIATGVISTHYDLHPHSSGGNGGDYMKYYYVKPWCRMGPYVVGILTGYLLYKLKGRIKIPTIINLFIWALMTGLALVILYGLHDYFNNGLTMDKTLAALYNTSHRTLWGVCVCWVIFACATGHGGFVNTLLSWKAFIPLARLSYCVYLVHLMVIYSYYYSMRQLIYLTDYQGIYLFLAHLVLANMAAFVASLLFEAPMLGLEKVIFKRGQDKKA